MANRGRPRYPDILTPREWQVLELLREELSNIQIAERLGISERTAKFHVSEILGKLGVESREEAAAWRSDERKGWQLAFPLVRWGAIAKIAGATVLAASAAGLAVLAWGLLRTEGTTDRIVENFQPTATLTQARGMAYDRLELLLEIDKPLYRSDEPVQLRLTVTNISDRPLTLYFLDEQRYDFLVGCRRTSIDTACFNRPATAELGKLSYMNVWASSQDVSFEEKREKLTLASGESVTYAETWNQRANFPHRPSDWSLPRTGEFHTRYLGRAELHGCIARTTTIAEEPLLAELACDRPHFGSVVFELVP